MRAVTAEEIRKIAGGRVVHGAALPRGRGNFKKRRAPTSGGMAQPDVIKGPPGGGIGISSGGGGYGYYGGGYGGSGGYGSGGSGGYGSGGSGGYGSGASGGYGSGGSGGTGNGYHYHGGSVYAGVYAYGGENYGGDGVAAGSATVAGDTVTYTNPNGTTYSVTGDKPDRDNNPLDVVANSSDAEANQQIGDDGGNAVFADPSDGWDAAYQAIDNANNYPTQNAAGQDNWQPGQATLNDVVSKLTENPDAPSVIQDISGINGNTQLSSLSPSGLHAWMEAYAQSEGWYAGH